MEADVFIKRVGMRTGLKDEGQTRNLIKAVFQALGDRISHHGGHNIAEQLPKELKNYWESGSEQHMRREHGVQRMNLEEFITRVKNEADLPDYNTARSAVNAVLKTLQEQISVGAAHAVENQLPEDLRELWRESSSGVVEDVFEEYGEEVTILGPEVDVPTGADMQIEPSSIAPDKPPTAPGTDVVGSGYTEAVEGEYGAERIGPSAASLHRHNAQLIYEIQNLLDSSDEIDSEKIGIHVHQGRVILTGSVKSEEQLNAAIRIAQDALGTIEVDNEIRIEPD